MSPQRVLPPQEQQMLREMLQAATINALMDSRRWQPGELAFQGGTCLHLVHGSARFSEDLDFMVRGGLSLTGLAKEVQRRLRLPPGVAADLSVSVTDAQDARNPHAFMVMLSGPTVIGSAKVKIELWQTPAEALSGLKLRVSKIQSSTGGPVFVPALELSEILADKVYALGARERLKPRDIFDLWWMAQTAPTLDMGLPQMAARLAIYPQAAGDALSTAHHWLNNAERMQQALAAPRTASWVETDLRRWLPSSWPLDAVQVDDMLAVAVSRLAQGVGLMQTYVGAHP